MHPQPRLGTRYEKSLKRRFEKADQVFSEIYLRKARLDKRVFARTRLSNSGRIYMPLLSAMVYAPKR